MTTNDRTNYSLDVQHPDSVVLVLRSVAERYVEDAASLDATDFMVSKPWTTIAQELERAADRIVRRLGESGYPVSLPACPRFAIIVGSRVESYRDALSEREAAQSFARSYDRSAEAVLSGGQWHAYRSGRLYLACPAFRVRQEGCS